jgi:hypothetical protein
VLGILREYGLSLESPGNYVSDSLKLFKDSVPSRIAALMRSPVLGLSP